MAFSAASGSASPFSPVAPVPPVHLVDATMFWSPTGGGVRRYLLAKQAWVAGQPAWRHTIATPSPDGAGQVGLPACPLPGSGGYRFPWRRGAPARVLDRLAPDVIEAGDPYRLAWSARDVAQRRGIPAVAFCHSNLERLAATWFAGPLAALAGAAARRYARHTYDGFDLVLAPSRAMRDQLLDWGVHHVACQPLGVNTHVFRPAPARMDWRQRLGLPAHARLLVYAGRFSSEKNLPVLCDAVRRLGAPYVLLAVGAGPRVPRGDGVRVLTHLASQTELASLMASADAFVHAGDQETFGLSALEALACGTPLVARRSAGLAELVDASVGMPVDAGDGAGFAEAIATLFDRDLEPLRRAARQRALEHDWQAVFASLFGHYQRLLGHRRAVAPATPLPAQRLGLP